MMAMEIFGPNAAVTPALISPETHPAPARLHLRPCDRERGHARSARHWGGDPNGGFPAIAATPPAAPIPPMTNGSAPCRNRQSTLRARPRDCRRMAPAPDTDRELDPWSAAARFAARERPGAAWHRSSAPAAAPSGGPVAL